MFKKETFEKILKIMDDRGLERVTIIDDRDETNTLTYTRDEIIFELREMAN